MYKANIESLNWKAVSLNEQKQMILNEATGEQQSMLSAIESKKRQIDLYQKNIIPALQKNYQTMQLNYEQNTGELFELFDAWQTLTMTQMEYLDQLQDLLLMQVEMDKILEQK
jgi:outer membrane protein TolC